MTQPKKGKPDRDVMLAQAEELFAEHGFGACSLRDVLKAMRCSTTAFYARFDGKDAVFEAIVADVIDDLVREASGRLREVRDVSEGFDAGLDTLVDVLLPHRRVIGLALSEGTSLPSIRELLANSFDTLTRLMKSQFDIIGLDDSHERAWAIVGAVHLQIVRWSVFERVDDAGFREAIRQATQPLIPVG